MLLKIDLEYSRMLKLVRAERVYNVGYIIINARRCLPLIKDHCVSPQGLVEYNL